jgi:hypothetical protein
LWTKRKTIKV